MILKEKLERINHIEENFPVATLRYKGIEVWPLIRLWLFKNMFYASSKNVTIQKKGVVDEIRYYFRLFLNTFLANLKDFRNTNFQLKQSDLVYVASVERRNEVVEEKYFSKFADAMYYFLQSQYSIQVLESSIELNLPTPKYFPAFNLNFRLYGALFLNKLKKQTTEEIESFEEFQVFLAKHDLQKEVSLTAKRLKRDLNLVLGYKSVFLRILKKIQPKIVFLTCFFAKSNFGLILAANELGIKTIEVQHGQQGDYNNMYASWKNIPKKGYQLLPTHYWMWGKRSADRIKAWAGTTSRHQVLVGGNPWLAYVVAKNRKEQTKKKQQKINILVSLQILDILEPSFLGNAIQQSPDHYTWYIRMHPRFKDENRVLQYFESKGAKNIELEKANTMKIYDLFSQMNFHITFWSTTAYEAIAFDVPTILIHPNGKDAMADYLNQGVFKYAENAEELLDAIAGNDFQKETEKYIEADTDVILRQVARLLNEK